MDRKFVIAFFGLLLAFIGLAGTSFWTISSHQAKANERISQLERRMVGMGARASYDRNILHQLNLTVVRVETMVEDIRDYFIPTENRRTELR